MEVLPVNSGHNECFSEYDMQHELINLLHKKKFYTTSYSAGINAKIYKEIRIPNIGRISDIIVYVTDRIIINKP